MILDELLIGLVIAIVGASQVFTTSWLSWPRRLIDKICSTSDNQVRHALKATLGWPTFLFGVLVALPLPERYDIYAAAIMAFFFVAYKLGGFTTAPRRLGQIIDSDAVDATPTAETARTGMKQPKS